MEHITLYYRQGASDKVYQAAIEPRDGGYVVHFAYGRRGATLATGTKTQAPVAYAAAKAIYDKLVAEKTAKGYTPGADGTPYHHTGEASRATGIHCQLLNPVEDDQVERLIADPAWLAQPKHDGRRLLIDKRGDVITGINRLGLTVALPETLTDDTARCPLDLILDGECIGETFHAFDALRIEGDDIGGLHYAERYLRLMNLLASFQHPHTQLVQTAFTPKQKADLLDQLKAGNAEGIVFKQSNAPYLAGRPASGGPQLKHKFCTTASLIVGKINAKRSVSLLLFEGDKIKAAGNVTIPPNHEVPQSGQVVECRYLYAYRESGAIFQPVFLAVRTDITSEECTTAQLKYKAEPTEEAA
ncbi:MAG: WGR domain-containing protein [Chthoniobacter sp.]|nr:WGR domain-containing protein [Chthoniobacter sp.]